MPFFNEQQLQEVSKQFQIYGEIMHAEPCKIGHINETYTATYLQGGVPVRYIHQKINTNVFKDPVALMDNQMRITRHIRSKLEAEKATDITRRSLTIVPTHDLQSFYRDASGACWRTFVFIERAQSFEAVQTPAQAFQVGKAIGKFQSLLVDLPGARLSETIPSFHHARKRFAALQKAIKLDHYNRSKIAAPEIKFALNHENLVDVLLKAQEKGQIPERITHNDTKFNNVMLDLETGEEMCVVDLDTVMPGLALYDFGDMVRTTTSPTLEDERDLSKVKMHMPIFKKLAAGYFSTAGCFLNKTERAHITFSGKLMTFVIGIRFLTDFLMGDTYFRVHRPNHNLDRVRTQFKLIQSIEEQADAMQKFVDKL